MIRPPQKTCDCDLGPEFERVEQPSGYVDRATWAQVKSHTHKQKLCPRCGLWSLWVPKVSSR